MSYLNKLSWVLGLPIVGVLSISSAPLRGEEPASFWDGVEGLSAQAKSQLVVHFDARVGVEVDDLGGVLGWEGRDADGAVVVNALRRGQPGEAADNIAMNAEGNGLVFRETSTTQTQHLFAELFDGENNLLNGGEVTIFWVGFYSSANPQGDGNLGRYTYNLGGLGPGNIAPGMNHQRRSVTQNVGCFVGEGAGTAGTTYLGSSISSYSDVPAVWQTIYQYEEGLPGGVHQFFVTGQDGAKVNLNVAQPSGSRGTTVFSQSVRPHLYIGAFSDPLSSNAASGGWSFIGEMRQLLVFEGSLSETDSALIEAALAELATVEEPSVGGEFLNRENTLVGWWKFQNPSEPMAAAHGEDLQVVGDAPSFFNEFTDDSWLQRRMEGVIETAAGPGNHLLATHGIGANGGGAKTNIYSVVFDFLVPAPSDWRSFIQADLTNVSAADFFVHNSNLRLGVGDLTYSERSIDLDTWYRLALTVDLRSGGSVRSYLDGELWHDHANLGLDSRIALDPQQVLLFADRGIGNKAMMVSQVAILDRKLQAQEVAALGGPGVEILVPPTNQTPNPSVSGESVMTAILGERLEFDMGASDSDGDNVQVRVDWGDGRLSEWSNFSSSGVEHRFEYAWIRPGNYTIRVITRDVHGAVSPWVEWAEVEVDYAATRAVPGEVKFISYNVWSHFRGNTALSETAGWLRQQNPDFVGLQELVNTTDEALMDIAKNWGHPHAVVARDQSSTVGLTSRYPIDSVVRLNPGSGVNRPTLHVQSGGYHIFVVHLAFGNLQSRMEDAAALAPLIEAAVASGQPVVVLGDFNAHMASDDVFLQGQTDLPSVLPVNHLRDGYFDFEVMDGFLAAGLVDPSEVPPGPENITFPTLLRPGYRPESLQMSRSYRVDFILTDESTGSRTSVEFPRDRVLDFTSDHYPVIARVETAKAGDLQSWIEGFPGLNVSELLEDSDGDGLSNLLEYILLGDPLVARSAQLPSWLQLGGKSVLHFQRRLNSAVETRQTVQFSTDLQDWTSVALDDPDYGSFIPISPLIEGVRVEVPASMNEETQVFGRLEVEFLP